MQASLVLVSLLLPDFRFLFLLFSFSVSFFTILQLATATVGVWVGWG